MSIFFGPGSKLHSFTQSFRRRRGFRLRRSAFGPPVVVNFFVAAALGVVSGNYIFKEPIEQYWKENEHLIIAAREERERKNLGKETQQNSNSGSDQTLPTTTKASTEVQQ